MRYQYLAKPRTVRRSTEGVRFWATEWVVEHMSTLRVGEEVFKGTEAQARAVAATLNQVRA